MNVTLEFLERSQYLQWVAVYLFPDGERRHYVISESQAKDLKRRYRGTTKKENVEIGPTGTITIERYFFARR